MKYVLIFAVTFISSLCYSQKEKEEAKKAFMEIVSCYFKKNCDKFYSYYNDTVSLLNQNTNACTPAKILLTEKKACAKFAAYTEKPKTFENYISNYLVAVMDYSEFTSPDRAALHNYFFEMSGSALCLMRVNVFNACFTKNDYLVIGDIPKEKKAENFIGGPYILMLRKTKTGWKISGLSE